MERIKYIIILCILAVSVQLSAQNVVSGKVTEMLGSSEEPCIGVNVTFQNSANRIVSGVVTDFNGNYSIKVPTGEKNLSLVFSYIGMKSQRFKYNGQKVLNVTMESDARQIKEVEVKGKRGSRNEMGVTERQMTFATQKIDMTELVATSPVTSIEEALQGQLGGVDILAAGDPGAKSNIRIRGTATLNSNADPLIVINGVPYNTTIDDSFDFNTASQEDFAQMLSLNPTDIETIEVLKDAASTAVYGTAGANGVLLITTKKGAMGKTKFTFSTKNSMKFEPKSMPMLSGNEYVAFMQEAMWNTARAKGLSSAATEIRNLFDIPEIGYDQGWRYFDEYNQDTDWLDYVTKDAFTTDNSFSMSGGGERANYRLSLSYMDEGGTTKGTDMNRLTTSVDIGYKFSEKLRVNAEYTYSDTHKDNPWTTELRAEAMRKMPNKSPYYIDDATGLMTSTFFTRQEEEFDGELAFSSNDKGSNSKNFHPIIMANESFSKLNTKEQKMTVRANWYANKHLTYYGYVSMKFNTQKTEAFLPQTATGVPTQSASDTRSTFANRSSDAYKNNFVLQTENKLMYSNEWLDKKHQLVVTGLWRTSQSRTSNYAAVRYNVASSAIADPGSGGGSLLSQQSGTSEVATLSAIGSIVYTLFDRYTVNGTANYEGKSSLGKDNRWGFFPSVGVSWQVQDETFMRWSKEWLTQFKLRASIGMSGNAPGGTNYFGTFSSLGNYMDGSAIAAKTIQLNNLKWESSTEYDLGTDIILWDGKLTASFDYYRKKTKDLLQTSVGIPSSAGYADAKIAYFNSGRLSNEGYEFRIDYEVLKSKNWQMKVNWNISRNINTIDELPSNVNTGTFSLRNGEYATKLLAGTAVGSYFGLRYLGVYDNTEDTYAKDEQGRVMRDLYGNPIVMHNSNITCFPGDAKYEDINHDGRIDQNDVVYLGNYNPIVSGGGGFNLKYKSLGFTVFFHYRLGQKIINQARMNAESMYGKDNQSTAVLGRWRNEGDAAITSIPRALYGYGLNYMGSDRFVEDCSFVRLKTLSVNYNFPKKFCKSLGVQTLSIFATGYDLFTFTTYKGQDPEVSMPSRITDIAMDKSQTPRSRRVSMGVTVNF